jgi:hypothetical protein
LRQIVSQHIQLPVNVLGFDYIIHSARPERRHRIHGQ